MRAGGGTVSPWAQLSFSWSWLWRSWQYPQQLGLQVFHKRSILMLVPQDYTVNPPLTPVLQSPLEWKLVEPIGGIFLKPLLYQFSMPHFRIPGNLESLAQTALTPQCQTHTVTTASIVSPEEWARGCCFQTLEELTHKAKVSSGFCSRSLTRAELGWEDHGAGFHLRNLKLNSNMNFHVFMCGLTSKKAARKNFDSLIYIFLNFHTWYMDLPLDLCPKEYLIFFSFHFFILF